MHHISIIYISCPSPCNKYIFNCCCVYVQINVQWVILIRVNYRCKKLLNSYAWLMTWSLLNLIYILIALSFVNANRRCGLRIQTNAFYVSNFFISFYSIYTCTQVYVFRLVLIQCNLISVLIFADCSQIVRIEIHIECKSIAKVFILYLHAVRN